MRRLAPQLIAHLFCISLFSFFNSDVLAQGTIGSNQTRQDIQYREWALRNIRRDTPIRNDREILAFKLQLKEDFRNLQLVNNELMSRVFSSKLGGENISQKEIRNRLGEIRKLAKRLRLNLGIPEVKSNETPANLALSPGLRLLDKTVMGFVENPLFQSTRVFDQELALQAGRDVSEILRLSDMLRSLMKE